MTGKAKVQLLVAASTKRPGELTLRSPEGGMAGAMADVLSGGGYVAGDLIDVTPHDDGSLREIAQIISLFGLRRDVSGEVWEETFHALERALNGDPDPAQIEALRDYATRLKLRRGQ